MADRIGSVACEAGQHYDCKTCAGCPCHPRGRRLPDPIETNFKAAMTSRPDPVDDGA